MSKSINLKLKKKRDKEKQTNFKFNPLLNPKFSKHKVGHGTNKPRGLGLNEYERAMEIHLTQKDKKDKKDTKDTKEKTNIELIKAARKNYERDLNIFKVT